jgi:DNA polymerase-3 subunit gamma/tau
MLCRMADRKASKAPYQVVARRFRPKGFDEVVGQEAVLQSLRLSLQQQRIPHAFLFAGSRGVGKTTMARILARCLNCERGPTPEPCGTCALCQATLEGTNTDVVEIDAASHNGVEDIRSMRERVGFAAMHSRYKVYILDEAHMLSRPAWNAFLKTLEEPPPNVVFVLATTELHKVPETIRSRCQVLLFRRIGDDDIVARLRSIAQREEIAIDDDVLREIAAGSRGGMRDAETALERVLPAAREQGQAFDLAAYRELFARVGQDTAVEVVTALLRGDAAPALHFARELQQSGVDEREALGELVEILRWLLLLLVDGLDSGLVAATGAVRGRLQELARSANRSQLEAMIQAGLLGRERLRRLEDRGVVFELTLVRMAQAGALPALADLLAEVRGGASMPAGPTSARAAAGAGAPRAGVAAPAVPAAAASGPPAAATPGAGAGDLRARVLALVADKPPLLMTLEQCRFEGPDAKGRVVVVLETDKKLYRDRLAAPGLQQQVQGLVRQALGQSAPVEFRIVDPQVASAPAAKAATAEPGPTTKRVLEKFGGRVVAVDPDDAQRGPAAGDGARQPEEAQPEEAPPEETTPEEPGPGS